MNLLLYFTSFTAVLALVASAIAIILWTLLKLLRGLVRLCKPAAKPQGKVVANMGKFQEDMSHPYYFKRAGQ